MSNKLRHVVFHLDGSILMGKTALAMEIEWNNDWCNIPSTCWGEKIRLFRQRNHIVLLQFDDMTLKEAFGWWPVPRRYVTYYPSYSEEQNIVSL